MRRAAILAVGAIEDRPVARDGAVVVRPMLTMTLTCDHRTIDGATAADFLRTVKEFVEERDLGIVIALDVSRSMRFGSVDRRKADLAVELERVGCCVT